MFFYFMRGLFSAVVLWVCIPLPTSEAEWSSSIVLFTPSYRDDSLVNQTRVLFSIHCLRIPPYHFHQIPWSHRYMLKEMLYAIPVDNWFVWANYIVFSWLLDGIDSMSNVLFLAYSRSVLPLLKNVSWKI